MAVRTVTTKLAVDNEAEFKRQMKSVDSALSTLKSSMALANAEFVGQSNTMDSLQRKHAILTDQIAQQSEKVKIMERALRDASEAFGESDTRTDDYRQKLYRAQAELIRMNDALETNDKYMEEAQSSADGLAHSIDGYGKEIKKVAVETEAAGKQTSIFGDVLKANLASDAIKKGIHGLGKAITALPVATVKALADAAKEVYTNVRAFADSAGDIDDAAKRTGATAEAYQEWAYAAKLGGMEVSTLESLMVKQQKSFSDAHEGVKATAEAYARLGIDINEVTSSSEAFDRVIYALADMEDETTRNALANDLFGKSYADLAPLLAEGADGIKAWRQEVVDLGGVISNDAVEAGAEFGDSLDRLQTRFDGLKNNLSADFLPAFSSVVEGMTGLLGGNVDEGVALISQGLDDAEDVLDRLGPAAEAALELFLEQFVEHFPDVVDRGGDLILKLVSGMGEKGPDIIKAAADAVNVLVDKLLDPDTLATIGEAGIDIAWALIKGIGSILANLGTRIWEDWVSPAITSVSESAKYAKEYLSGANGNHASGLAYVPWDNYRANLHEGEMVLTRREAEAYRSGDAEQEPRVVVIHTHVDLDGREVGRSVSEYQDSEGRARGR